jgi:hypothetical protein
MADIHDEKLSAVMSELGRRGGSARTPRKRAASARNLAAYWQRRAAEPDATEQAKQAAIPAIWSLGLGCGGCAELSLCVVCPHCDGRLRNGILSHAFISHPGSLPVFISTLCSHVGKCPEKLFNIYRENYRPGLLESNSWYRPDGDAEPDAAVPAGLLAQEGEKPCH